jgi:bifunctional UDP-N-acetylglucosamine pyrophosphorylase/glucosamine-1-phosphate N-acetyltransferase
MHLVILAAGTGSRLHPLTDTVPKPLLSLCGQSIIEHSISDIIEYFDDIYIIVKYMKESFVEYFGDTYLGKKVHYVDQIETGGT